jgi:transcriptional regulator with XRE-family HTH domain
MSLPPKLMNGSQIQARRVALGLTVPALAAQLGVGVDLVRAIEGGAIGRVASLPLDVLLRLAQTLQLAFAELFTTHEGDPVAAPGGDDRTIEAALLTYGDTVTTDALAEALGWSYGRLERALDALDRRLQATGARLCRAGWHRYRIQPNHRALPERTWRRLDELHHQHVGLTAAAATWLYLLTVDLPVSGEGWELNKSLRQLRQQHLIDGDQPPYRLSVDVRYSLGLDEWGSR